MLEKLKTYVAKVHTFIKPKTPSVVQVVGLAVFAVGPFLLAPWLGFMIAGGLICLVGWAFDK